MAWIAGNRYLSLAEMKNNAEIIQGYGLSQGWTPNAICAMLGNMQSESGINPGIWENLTPYGSGFGLVQWTPYTKFSSWAGTGWQTNYNKQLDRISWEIENNQQWFYNSELGIAPPYTFAEFVADDETDLATMANYFLWFYEHPANPTQTWRGTQAQYWYDNLNWDDPPGPEPPEPPEPEFPWWILFKFRGRGLR